MVPPAAFQPLAESYWLLTPKGTGEFCLKVKLVSQPSCIPFGNRTTRGTLVAGPTVLATPQLANAKMTMTAGLRGDEKRQACILANNPAHKAVHTGHIGRIWRVVLSKQAHCVLWL